MLTIHESQAGGVLGSGAATAATWVGVGWGGFSHREKAPEGRRARGERGETPPAPAPLPLGPSDLKGLGSCEERGQWM